MRAIQWARQRFMLVTELLKLYFAMQQAAYTVESSYLGHYLLEFTVKLAVPDSDSQGEGDGEHA